MTSEERIVRKLMFDNDAFSKWLEIEVLSVSKGSVELKMKVRPEMTNGFDIAHGGIAFSLADSALAFAANSHGIKALTIETSSSFIKPLKSGEIAFARTNEIQLSNRFGRYLIEISFENGALAAVFYGTVYRTGEKWIV